MCALNFKSGFFHDSLLFRGINVKLYECLFFLQFLPYQSSSNERSHYMREKKRNHPRIIFTNNYVDTCVQKHGLLVVLAVLY